MVFNAAPCSTGSLVWYALVPVVRYGMLPGKLSLVAMLRIHFAETCLGNEIG
jgi:hypothetical protein